MIGVVATALALPFKPTKLVLILVLGVYFIRLVLTDMSMALRMASLSVPAVELTPRGLTIIPGANVGTLVMLLLVLGWVRHEHARPRKTAPPTLPLKIPVLLVVLSTFFGLARSAMSQTAPVFDLIQVFKDQFLYVLLFAIAYRCLDGHDERKGAVWTILAVDVLVSLQSIVEYGGGARERSTGLVGAQPNLYGGFLGMQIPFLLAMALTSGVPLRQRALSLVGMFVLIQALLLTGSRGAWVGTAVALGIFGLLASRKALLLLAVLGLALPLMMYGFSQSRFDSLVAPLLGEEAPDQSGAYRREVWRNFFNLLSPSYVFGRGFLTAQNVIYSQGLAQGPKSTHSSILTLAIEQGLVGVLLYAVLLTALFGKAFRSLRRGPTPLAKVLGAGFIGAVPALLVCDFTGERFFSGQVMAFFWLLAGIMMRELVTPPEGDRAPGVGGRPGAEVAPAGGGRYLHRVPAPPR